MFYARRDSGRATHRTYPAVKVQLIPVRHLSARQTQYIAHMFGKATLPALCAGGHSAASYSRQSPALYSDGRGCAMCSVRRHVTHGPDHDQTRRSSMSGVSQAHRLPEGWKVQDFPPGGGLTAGAHQPRHADGDWLGIAVPGDVHRTLIAAGRIPDPFYDRNETACAWMEEREWWYRLTFDGPAEPADADERLQVVFEGLDTFATVYLNGDEIGEHHNMLRPAAFDVT